VGIFKREKQKKKKQVGHFAVRQTGGRTAK
jgi:hypothetical protein